MNGTRPGSAGASAAERAEEAVAGVLTALGGGSGRGVVVDSPPGAGKSALVVRAAAELAEAGEPVMVIAQTNEQVDDLAVRLAQRRPDLAVGRLSASDYRASARIEDCPSVTVAAKVGELGHCPVLIGTAAKWATLSDEERWPWAIVDEAYQMRSDTLLRVAGRFDRGLFVGDPGQLDPFSTVDTQRWLGLTWDPAQSAVSVLLRHNPDVPVMRLPVSWRLPASAAPVVADAFYPFTGFDAGTTLCVLTSRHRHAAIVVARAGIPELLDARPASEPVYLNVPAKFPDGWEANHSVMEHLRQWGVRAL